MPSCKYKKGGIPYVFKEITPQLGIINYTAQYSGWRGMLYDERRYAWRGKFAESRFKKNCLSEYAEVFKTVCVDGAYYKFPEQRYLEGMVSQVTDDFQFAFKVTDEITIKKFPNLPRFGVRAGKPNENFLNADLFTNAFLKPCEPFRKNVGLLMFEFSKFWQTDYESVSAIARQHPKHTPTPREQRRYSHFRKLARNGRKAHRFALSLLHSVALRL